MCVVCWKTYKQINQQPNGFNDGLLRSAPSQREFPRRNYASNLVQTQNEGGISKYWIKGSMFWG